MANKEPAESRAEWNAPRVSNPVAEYFEDSSMASALYGGVPNKFNRDVMEENSLPRPRDPLGHIPRNKRK